MRFAPQETAQFARCDHLTGPRQERAQQFKFLRRKVQRCLSAKQRSIGLKSKIREPIPYRLDSCRRRQRTIHRTQRNSANPCTAAWSERLSARRRFTSGNACKDSPSSRARQCHHNRDGDEPMERSKVAAEKRCEHRNSVQLLRNHSPTREIAAHFRASLFSSTDAIARFYRRAKPTLQALLAPWSAAQNSTQRPVEAVDMSIMLPANENGAQKTAGKSQSQVILASYWRRATARAYRHGRESLESGRLGFADSLAASRRRTWAVSVACRMTGSRSVLDCTSSLCPFRAPSIPVFLSSSGTEFAGQTTRGDPETATLPRLYLPLAQRYNRRCSRRSSAGRAADS